MGILEDVERRRREELDKLKPVFLGFTGGIRKDESMADFVNRINKEGGRNPEEDEKKSEAPYCHNVPMQAVYRYRYFGVVWQTWKCNFCGEKKEQVVR